MHQKRPVKNKTLHQHEFAFFAEHVSHMLSSFSVGSTVQISDPDLFHRIARVVRLKIGQGFILFDRESHMQLEVRSFEGKKLEGTVLRAEKNRQLIPTITFWLPLLKRDYFQNALYSLAECGSNSVQPVITKGVQRRWGGQKERARSLNIMTAAAEQSKHFAFPELHDPRGFEACCESVQTSDAIKLFFDPSGQLVSSVLHSLKVQNPRELILAIGPEGDLSQREKKMLEDCGFLFCALTPTILRAQQAASLSIGLSRVFFRREA